MTGSALDLGLVGLAQFVPAFLLLAVVVGPIADRYDRSAVVRPRQIDRRRRCAGAGDRHLATACSPASLILALVFVLGAGTRLRGADPAGAAAALVPLPVLPRAVAAPPPPTRPRPSAGRRSAGSSTSSARRWSMPLCAAAFVGASVLICSHPRRAGRPEAREGRSLAHCLAGIAFIRKAADPGRDLARHVRGAVRAARPRCCRSMPRTFSMSGPGGSAFLRAMPAVGALLMAIFLAHHSSTAMSGARCFVARSLFGVATHRLRAVDLAVAVLCDAGDRRVRRHQRRDPPALVQIRTPNEMLGRVMSVNSLFIGTSTTSANSAPARWRPASASSLPPSPAAARRCWWWCCGRNCSPTSCGSKP